MVARRLEIKGKEKRREDIERLLLPFTGVSLKSPFAYADVLSLPLYVRILLALVAEPALKAEGLRRMEGGLPTEGKGFNTRTELSKLAGGCSHTVIDMVRYTERKK